MHPNWQLPSILIVGRSNVGKSTLFNLLIRKRKAVTASQECTTRDYIEAECFIEKSSCVLIDSGGIGEKVDSITDMILAQTEELFARVDIILFMVEVNGLTSADYHIIDMLRKYSRKVMCVVNKSDRMVDSLDEFFSIGYTPVVIISAIQKRGIQTLKKTIQEKIHMVEKKDRQKSDEETLGTLPVVSIVGRPNVGKSTLLNSFVGYQRTLVADIPGLTRDSVSARVTHERCITMIDTSGLTRRRVKTEKLDFYAHIRTYQSMRQSDIVLVVLDATEGITKQDARIVSQAWEYGKPVLLIVNKWDLVDSDEKGFQSVLVSSFPHLQNFLVLFCSARKKEGLTSILDAIERSISFAQKRVSTHLLNERVSVWTSKVSMPIQRGARTKILYATQVSVKPPCFIFVVNRIIEKDKVYMQYLENKIREEFFLKEIPICVRFRKKR